MIRSLAQVPEETPYEAIGTVWTKLYGQCLTMMPDSQCRGLLGYRPIYFPTTCVEKPKFTLPWWGYMVAGWLIARFI